MKPIEPFPKKVDILNFLIKKRRRHEKSLVMRAENPITGQHYLKPQKINKGFTNQLLYVCLRVLRSRTVL